ncbi:MAG TPA: hypothetical protein VGB85_00845 [Nannocystis sp.]
MPIDHRIFAVCGALALLAGCPAEFGTGDDGGTTSSSSGDAPPGDDDGGPGLPTSSSGPEPTTSGATSTSGTTEEAAQTCGDGVLDPGEGCDEGIDNAIYAACTDECQLNVCGDSKVHVGVETCDEGSENVDTGYCRSDCQLGICGDGFVFAALESCDAGGANGPEYGQCDESCTINRCGDGELDVGHEQCDDGALNGSGEPGELGQAGCDVDCGFFGRRIFLSSQVFTGDMGTRAGADLACEIMATQAGFKAAYRYRALLADSKGSPNSFVVPDPDGRPFILPGGLIVAASYAELIQLGPGEGVTTTEQGEMLFEEKVWTNVNPAGDAYLDDPASTCAEWSSADKLKSARAGINAVAPGDAAALAEWRAQKHWLSAVNLICSKQYRIYCIEAS